LSAQEIFFRTVSVEDGLSNNFIRKIYRDSRGFIWLGTLNGLDRFNGLSFKPYIAADGQKGNVYDLLETSPDFLWVATDQGLWALNYDDEKLYPFELGTDCKVQCLAKGAGDRLLVGTTQGLFVISGQKVQLHILPGETGANVVWGICPDEAQTCWLATTAGLFRCDYSGSQPQVIRYQKEGSNPYRAIVKVGPAIFLGTHGEGVIKFDIRSQQFTKYINVGNEHVLYMSGDGKDHLWVGTDGGGLKKISVSANSIVASYSHHSQNPASIGSNAVYSALDNNGTLWVGTYSTGLSYSISKLFHTWSFENFSTRHNHIRSFAVNGHEKLVGTRDGFIYIDENRNIIKTFKEGLPGCEHLLSNTIISIYPYGQKYLLGTLRGLSVFDTQKQTIARFDNHPLFASSSFYGFTADRNSHLWMATFNGVVRYSLPERSVKQYTTLNSTLKHNIVHCIKTDSKDRIWIGTKTGVCFYDPASDSIRSVSILPASVDNCKITHIYEDRNTNIWFCTETDGLYTVNSDLTMCEHYTTDNHLPDKSVTSIMEDDLGFFWVATHKGLARCTFVDNKCHTFWLSDGLPGLMFNPGACYYDRQASRLWWGNESGLVYCDTKDVNTGNPLPHVQLIRFYINGKEIITGDTPLNRAIDRCTEIKLSHTQNSFGFDFVALNYIYPNDHTFETQLDGYDREWFMLDKGRTSAQYSNIGAGKYVFRVRLAGHPETEKSIRITIKRSWNVALWLIPIIALFGAWLWYWKRLRVLIRKQKIDAKRKAARKEPHTKALSKANQERHQTLLRLMEEKKPYLDPDLKSAYLATALKCTPAELSQIFKTSLQQSFSDFVNGYRIEEFKQKVARHEHEKYTLLALSEQCGFSSRSSFFRIFKNIAGVTPAEYLKQMEQKDT
jgi:ligand-binding sensor domain-containing protein/AraC-like DNA-binding protein